MTQLRRNIPTDLGVLLDSKTELMIADLVTLTLSDGITTFKWTDFDAAVKVGAETWVIGPGIKTGRMKWSAGLEVDTLTMSIMGDASTLLNGSPIMPFINGGGLDGASVNVWRAYAAATPPGTPITWVGKLLRMNGKVSDIDRPSRVEASITIRSVFELLNQQLPRNVCQPSCLNAVYDAACGLNRTAFQVSGSLTAGSDSLRITVADTTLTQDDGYFDLGAIRFVTGPNNGVMRTIRSFTGGQFTLVQPLPVAAGVGDEFIAYPGCNLSLNTCASKFGNAIHFRGQPWIPVADTVL